MRIRKRKVPLPLSLLSPIPLTDPHLFSRSPVESDHNFYDHVTIPTCCSASDLRPLTTVSLATTGVEGVQISNDDSSNASITTSAPQDDDINNLHNNSNNNGPLLLSNNEGVIPLKKRRTMIAKRGGVGNDEEEFEEEKKKMMMKSNNNNNNNGENSKKNNGGKRGSTIMEGSRCSRVNGRGWRCCQQTLVGYSLCEHHLGKGRLRSMTGSSSSNKTATAAAAKSRSSKKKNANNNNNNKNNNSNNDDNNNNNNDSNSNTVCSFNTTGAGFMLGSHYGQQIKEETCANNSKRVKLGVVKARSLSSLLGQTNGMNNDIVGDHANMHPQQEKMSN